MKSLSLKLMGLLPCLLLVNLCTKAQNYIPDSLVVRANAVYDGNQVIIRWVPFNYETWQWGLEHGYRLERTTIKNNGADLTIGEILNSKVLLDSNIVQVSETEWDTLMENNDMAGVAAGVIHGDSMEVISYDEAGFMDVINQNQERENRFSFALFAADNSFEVAAAMGIGFIDTTVVAGKEYIYTVKINNMLAGITVINGHTVVETAAGGGLPAPQNLVAIPGDHSVLLTWDSEGLGDHYTSYCMEYSSDGGTTFQPAHDLPLIFGEQRGSEPTVAAFQDSLTSNGTTYIYRVKGKSPFGAMGPYSDTVHVVGRPNPLGTNPAAISVQEVNEGMLTIHWEFPDSLESKITGFDVYRSDKVAGTYAKINTTLLAVTSRFFEDPDPSSVNYYKVKSEDENGYSLESNAVLGQPADSIPPASPTGLIGMSDETGLVTLTWNKNTEEDLMGYRVFISNTIEGDFVQITNQWVNDTTFKYHINLNTLSEYVYFAVKAIDYRQNPSGLSTPCTVERPDIIPPSPPSISKVTAEPDMVHFEWELSSSIDVIEHKFQRKPNGAPGWVTLTSFDRANTILSYTDSTASYNQYWDYRLLAIDEVGLIGSSKVIKAKPVDIGIRDTIANFSGQLRGASLNQIVDLGWDYINDPDIEGFEIFRAIDNNEKRSFKFVTLAEAKGSQSQSGASLGYLDFDTDFKYVPVQTTYTATLTSTNTVITGGNVNVNGNTYTITPTNPNTPTNPQSSVTLRYWIMAKFIDGATSPLSNAVVVQVQ